MKTVKLVRLQEKDSKGNFKKAGNHVVLRERVKVSEQTIAEFDAEYEATGLLYVVIEDDAPKAAPKAAPAKEEKAAPAKEDNAKL